MYLRGTRLMIKHGKEALGAAIGTESNIKFRRDLLDIQNSPDLIEKAEFYLSNYQLALSSAFSIYYTTEGGKARKSRILLNRVHFISVLEAILEEAKRPYRDPEFGCLLP